MPRSAKRMAGALTHRRACCCTLAPSDASAGCIVELWKNLRRMNMKPIKLRSLAAGLAFALVPAFSIACGPDFPAELLGDRAATMGDLPEGAFYFEASRLVAPAQR